ncbi:uncharacterized protein MONBRDRAFT_33135 [Monosiga brevicollis MX1]|uniref:Guanine nucleotide exchange factor MSS4 n=1 Tax=Monosiga brevicollis TaxID=81824 RepID=A9V3X0_MONBE|nr:uncharacterized protein MONBRDRAFT_33135 [Monosiga brevicollis MX1]EDQ87878.1 predicted protein [Monosiga brevicollis MX1]|eukprot:XP_001747411.1 hypothetical protein [Monosiga brevicollis MX1]
MATSEPASSLADLPNSDQGFDRAVLVNESNGNILRIRCCFCNSPVFSKSAATATHTPVQLPKMVQRGAEGETVTDTCEHWWQVKDMYDFDNVGFSKTVDGVKYLACADCEIGPIGYHDPSAEPKTFNIAHARIRYTES